MIRVLVVDDHVIVRRGIVQILAEARDMVVAAQASTAAEALQRLREADYQVVLLDIALPDGNGLHVLKQMRLLKPRLAALILSVYPEEQYAVRAFKAGALGYLTKDTAPVELITAVRRVARGGRYVSSSLGERLAARLAITAPGIQPHDALSDRENQVMCLLAAGETVSQIAVALSLSVKTVSTYRSRILTKLGLETTAAIVRYALEYGLFP